MSTYSICPFSQLALHDCCSVSGSHKPSHQTVNNVNSKHCIQWRPASKWWFPNSGNLYASWQTQEGTSWLTFLQDMLHWLVCWVSVRYQVAQQEREDPLQGRDFYHHWRSPNRWCQKTTVQHNERTTFSAAWSTSFKLPLSYCCTLTTSVLSEKTPSCRLSGAIHLTGSFFIPRAPVPAGSSSWHTHPLRDQSLLSWLQSGHQSCITNNIWI